MNNDEIKTLYKLQTKNVKYLKKVQKNFIKDNNIGLRKNDNFSVDFKTKMLSLLFSTLSEAQFTQILYTPNGLYYSEIEKISSINNIVLKWEELLEVSLTRVGDWTQNPDLEKKRNIIKSIIKDYIEKPQLLRNKIAHGQWIYALNKYNTREVRETSEEIKKLDVVTITKWFDIHQYLCFLMRDLVQSPHKSFHQHYWTNFYDLESYLDKTRSWNLDKRITILNRKKYHSGVKLC
ncbi:hypothetical protein EW093_16670 [Thiospirochaeta perfilievii]|uniref:Uncharacterized protein n=1 Tax=Thiospirochaeta perfilievii TaxID=252967 RepID=A0A5C1QJA4_9SPIO|nr:hypothetical protein [Thiospirochaeta perfilievii]QEN06252.1 hypothetical protein EW093_16670 [Thiospirochaeta perfilievii]